MKYFSEIISGISVVRSKGVYKQVQLYRYGNRVFAKYGGGFIGLVKHQYGTTKPDVLWIEVNIPHNFDSMDNMIESTS